MTEPDVCVPAVLRSYHEVLRNDLARVLVPLADTGDLDGFAAAWQAHTRASAVHAAMENGVPGATRVFVHALKTVCTAGQWARCLPLARQAAAAGVWAAVLDQVPSLEAAPAPLPPITPAMPTPRAA